MEATRDPDFVNVQTEIDYWKQRFSTNILMGENFRNECEPLVKLACDVTCATRTAAARHGSKICVSAYRIQGAQEAWIFPCRSPTCVGIGSRHSMNGSVRSQRKSAPIQMRCRESTLQ